MGRGFDAIMRLARTRHLAIVSVTFEEEDGSKRTVHAQCPYCNGGDIHLATCWAVSNGAPMFRDLGPNAV
jgi:hypothetical protein